MTLRQEIPFEFPLVIPQDSPWILTNGIAVHPDGKRAFILIPGEKRIELQNRTTSGHSERTFLLTRVDLALGDISGAKEHAVVLNHDFGFSLDRLGNHLCLIAGQKVMVLDANLSTVDWVPSTLSNPQGQDFVATKCTFVPGSSAVLVEYFGYVGNGFPWEWRSAFMEWNWKQKAASLIRWDQYIPDAVPLGESRVVLYQPLPEWLYRFKLVERELRGDKVYWEADYEGFHSASLVITDSLLISVDRLMDVSADLPDISAPNPDRFHDAQKPIFEVRVRSRRNPAIELLLPLTGRVLIRDKGGSQRPAEFRMRGNALHWPLVVSRDESWFVVRATDFSHFGDDRIARWDSNRFVFFSLDGTNRRLYTSTKFGPEEAITGFALTPDDKTLVVATSRRLLIYDVKATPAN